MDQNLETAFTCDGSNCRQEQQRGYALLLTLFLLAIATGLCYVIIGNSLSTRQLTRATSQEIGARQRVTLATWQVLDSLAVSGKALTTESGQIMVDGQTISLVIGPETGRIDLNGLSRSALKKAIQSLGFSERRATVAADQIAQWRGMDPPGADSSKLTMNGRTALWSLDDLDVIPGLDEELRDCLRALGTVHARGQFTSRDALGQHKGFATTGFGNGGSLVAGTMIRVIASDILSGAEFRSVVLFRGLHYSSINNMDKSHSSWMVLEWIRKMPSSSVRCPY